MGITKYLIDNPIVKWMVLGILFTFSFLSITSIKRFAYPRVDLNQVTITSVVPGFSVNEIEIRVTRKINEKLKAVEGIKKFNSTSYQNYSSVLIDIDPDSDVQAVKDNIRNEINAINDFPVEMVNDPQIFEIKIDTKPTMVLAISPTDPKNYDPLKLSQQATALREWLKNSDSVSQVYEDIPQQQVHILLDKEKMKSYQITFEEVYAAIGRDQVRLSAGNLESASEVKSIITLSQKQGPEEIQNIILRAGGYRLPGSPIIRIKDIGKVVFSLPKENRIYHINGNPGYKIEVVKKNQIDIIVFSDAIDRLIAEFQGDHPDFKVIIHHNDSWETEQRLSIALNNGFSSLLLIAVTLILFLKLPIALWAIVEMPVTILFSVILIWAADITINNVSLCGIILTLGIIVDNPTVIGEMTMYYQEKGLSPTDASLMAVKKIFKPLLFSLLTTLASFASMFFIPGMLGDFAIEIPLTVTFMLASSFVESVFILPSHLAHTPSFRFKPLGNRVLEFHKRIYHITLTWFLKRPLLFVIAVSLIFGLATWKASQGITFYLFSTEQSGGIHITGKTPSNSSLSFTESQVKRIENLIDQLPEGMVVSYISTIGGSSLNYFKTAITLTPFFDREMTADQIRALLADRVKEANLPLTGIDYTLDSGGPPSGKPIEINIFHVDTEIRKRVTATIMDDLKSDSIFSEVNSDFEEGMTEIQVRPKPEAYFAGIGSDRIAQILRFAFEGIKVNESEIHDKNTEWILKLDENSKNLQKPLDGLFINSPIGNIASIDELVEISETKNTSKIVAERGKTKNMITANFDVQKVSSQKVLLNLSEKYRNLSDDFPGLEIAFSGEAKENFDTFQTFIYAIIGSIILIYMLLVIQFKNLTQPFLVISSIPFGIAGIIIAFNLQNTNISFLTMIGILGFGGVVVNSSIIMIDFINDLKSDYLQYHSDTNYEEGYAPKTQGSGLPSVREVIIEGALARFRPILITTGSTVVGLFPLAYAVLGQTDSTISPMTMGMVWGMVFGTMATLYIVPAIYLVDSGLSNYISSLKKTKPTHN